MKQKMTNTSKSFMLKVNWYDHNVYKNIVGNAEGVTSHDPWCSSDRYKRSMPLLQGVGQSQERQVNLSVID